MPLQRACTDKREVVDLRAGIVVVELARDIPAGRFEQARDAIADRRGAPVADMQRSGRIGRNELDADPASAPLSLRP